MDITRRKLLGYLLSGVALSASSFATHAADALFSPLRYFAITTKSTSYIERRGPCRSLIARASAPKCYWDYLRLISPFPAVNFFPIPFENSQG